MSEFNLTPLNFLTGLGNVSCDISIASDASSFLWHNITSWRKAPSSTGRLVTDLEQSRTVENKIEQNPLNFEASIIWINAQIETGQEHNRWGIYVNLQSRYNIEYHIEVLKCIMFSTIVQKVLSIYIQKRFIWGHIQEKTLILAVCA